MVAISMLAAQADPVTLADLERLAEQATPGPWWAFHSPAAEICHEVQARTGRRLIRVCSPPEATVQSQYDMEFIAAAREWLPKLIAVAKAAQQVREYIVLLKGTRAAYLSTVAAYDALGALVDALAALEPPTP